MNKKVSIIVLTYLFETDISWYGKTRVMSYELRVTSSEFRVEIQRCELKFKSASSHPRVTS